MRTEIGAIKLGAPVYCFLVVIVHDHHHPHANLAIARHERRAMNPTIASFRIRSCDPLDSSSHTAANHHSLDKVVFHSRGTTDSGEEGRLEHAWDLEGGGGKQDPEGRVWSNEEVLHGLEIANGAKELYLTFS